MTLNSIDEAMHGPGGGRVCGDGRQGARRYDIEGRSLGYPTSFRDGSSAAGLFVVSASAADALIADSGFQVAKVAPGRAIFAFTCVHYTDTDCGAYEEIAMAFFVKKMGGASGLPYLGTWRDILRGEVAVSRVPDP